ncbi:MAG: hypothetical protein PHT12_00385 [Patescibacteria group bacterium]|nr:hypothetical protein [Patescibacteria group bacterium]
MPIKPKKKSAKMTKDQWLLLLLNDSDSFVKTKAAMKPAVEAALAKRRGLKPADAARLSKILDMLVGFAARLYVEDIWANRRETFAAYADWFLKEAVKGYDTKIGQVDSDKIRERLQEHFGGCSGGSCGHGH